MTQYFDINGGVVRIPRNFVAQVNKDVYDGNAKLGEVVLDMVNPAAPVMYIGNVTGNLTAVLTGPQTTGNIINLYSNTINSNTIYSNTANIVDLNVSNNVNFSNSANVNLGNVSNLHISGGSNLQVLTTDGNGNLTWTYKVAIGDIKQSMLAADHDGWFKMDGRALAVLGLTATQTAAAALLGITSLPDATDRVLKQKAGAIGSTGGQNSVTLAATNLPSAGLTTGPGGAHGHGSRYRGVSQPSDSGYNLYSTDYNSVRYDLIEPAGDHTHPITGGSDTPFSIESAYVSVNAFVFLGT